MMQSIRSDKAWFRQWNPNASSDQIERFTERVGMKVDDDNPPPDVLAKARDEAFKEMGLL